MLIHQTLFSTLAYGLLFFLAVSNQGYSLTTTGDARVKSYAIAMHGSPKYKENFQHFDYVEPTATKSGKLKLAEQGSFDSLNPFIAKGNSEANLGWMYDTLLVSSKDEAFTEYGLIAESVEYPADRSWIIFNLRPQATFSDDVPITAEDVVFSFNILIDQGNPFYQSYYGGVKSVTAITPHKVRFDFKPGTNQELPLIIGQLPVLPKHYWQDKDFASASTAIPIGSGPYSIKSFEFGRSITYQRNKDYWAKDLNVNVGHYNFDLIQVDYYKDSVVLLEALKAGQYDFRLENSSKQWATGYSGQALDNGELILEQVTHEIPQGMQAFLFNLRNPLFQDIRVRQAIGKAFNFEWSNQNLFYNAYKRTESFFSNSELQSSGLPSKEELDILSPYKDQLPKSVFEQAYRAPQSNGDQYNRSNLIAAQSLFEDAGWRIVDNILINQQGQALKFEIILVQPSLERIVNPFIQALKKLGVQASVRHVEVSQYIHRLRHFKYDMIVSGFGQSLSPGNEQVDYWHSSKADLPASRNRIGIKNPVIDQLIELIVSAPDRASLITRTKALDRVLLHHHFVIPQFHISSHRLAYWNKFNRPAISPKYDNGYTTSIMTWWPKEAGSSQ